MDTIGFTDGNGPVVDAGEPQSLPIGTTIGTKSLKSRPKYKVFTRI